MKATWKGYLTIGQLGVPLRLYPASRTHRPRFKLLHDSDGSPVDRVLYCRAEGRQISMADTVRGIVQPDGRYVTFTEDELQAGRAESSQTMEVRQFIALADVEIIYFERPFYISAARGGEKAYALLREAFTRCGVAAVVQFTLHARSHLGVIGVSGDMLMLYQLRYAAELVPRSELKTPPLPKPAPSELEAMTELIRRYSGPFFPRDYQDEQANYLTELLESKSKGLPPPRQERLMSGATREKDLLAAIRHAINEAPSAAKLTPRSKPNA